MPEIYTCICGIQRWIIFWSHIECDKCGREYTWKVGIDGQIESPEEFNKRIKTEAAKEAIEGIAK